VGRLCRARVQPAVGADELVGGDGADLRRPSIRLAGRARRIARDLRRLAAVVSEHGGHFETGRRVRSLSELPAADAVVLDLAPGAVAEIAGERLPARVARAYRRYRHGPGAFKVDLAVAEGVPWTSEPARRAGTVHAAGSFAEIAAAEQLINRGRMPERPFVIVCQQSLADPTRAKDGVPPGVGLCARPARLYGRRDRGR